MKIKDLNSRKINNEYSRVNQEFSKTLILSKIFFKAMYLILFLIMNMESNAQLDLNYCSGNDPVFLGTPEETLCDIYGNIGHPISIGVGTSYEYSSQIGISLIGETVYVEGDFVVNSNFKFQNCIIKIEPNSSIFVTPLNVNTGIKFIIDNSKLFSCNGMWEGIILSDNTFIHTRNGSIIEDAVNAIKAEDSYGAFLFIENTTFNKNEIGILLDQSEPNNNPANIYKFVSNTFSCTSPLNGTEEDISLAGIKINNYQSITLNSILSSNYSNKFIGLKYGIFAGGSIITIVGKYMRFENIYTAGIFVDEGLIDLNSATFKNCDKYGIQINLNYKLSLNSCQFLYDDNLSDPGVFLQYRDGINVQSFGASSLTRIRSCRFITDFTDEHRNIRGMLLQGGNVGGGSKIYISNNTWIFKGKASRGIDLNGIFPKDCNIDIYNNTFRIQSCCVGDHDDFEYPVGIWIFGGNKYNTEIYGNQFYNFVQGGPRQLAIVWYGTQGTNNEFSDNTFPFTSLFYSFDPAVKVRVVDNLTLCSNIFKNNRTSFEFSGLNNEIDLVGNENFGNRFIRVLDGWIEDQEHKGNTWQILPLADGIHGAYVSISHAQMDGDNPQFSSFFVHTQQSTTYFGNGWNPYHLKDIVPDDNDDWWSVKSGMPSGESCITRERPKFLTNVKKEIADGEIGDYLNDQSLEWQAVSGLYRLLKQNPDSISTYSGFSSFLSSYSNTSIGKLFEVYDAIENKFLISDSIKLLIENKHLILDSLIQDIWDTDSLMAISNDSLTITSKISAKTNLLQEIGNISFSLEGYHSAYHDSLIASLENIRDSLWNITPTSKWESNEKMVYSIYLNFIENGTLNSDELDSLYIIAEQCPKEGGMPVLIARSLLPTCMLSTISDGSITCYPIIPIDTSYTILDISSPFSEDEPGLNILGEKDESQTFHGQIDLVPNPTSEDFNIVCSYSGQFHIAILDLMGKKYVDESIYIGNNISTANLNSGLYFVQITLANGISETRRLLIVK